MDTNEQVLPTALRTGSADRSRQQISITIPNLCPQSVFYPCESSLAHQSRQSLEQQEEVEGVGAKESVGAREAEERELGGRAAGSSRPGASEKEETPNLFFLPAAGKRAVLRLREAPGVVQILVGEGERVCACARASVYERGAGGRRAAGMAEKRRGSPCSMLSLKAHAFSVEALIGAEKQQQLQKKRRKLGAEEAAGAVEDGGCGRGGEKGSSEGDEGAALPPPAGAASGPARSCADLEPGCGPRGAAGESAPSHPTPRRVPSRAPGPRGRGEPELLRVRGSCAPQATPLLAP